VVAHRVRVAVEVAVARVAVRIVGQVDLRQAVVVVERPFLKLVKALLKHGGGNVSGRACDPERT